VARMESSGFAIAVAAEVTRRTSVLDRFRLVTSAATGGSLELLSWFFLPGVTKMPG